MAKSRSLKHYSVSKKTGKSSRCHSRRKKTLPVAKLRALARSRNINLGRSKKKTSIIRKLRSRGVSKHAVKC